MLAAVLVDEADLFQVGPRRTTNGRLQSGPGDGLVEDEVQVTGDSWVLGQWLGLGDKDGLVDEWLEVEFGDRRGFTQLEVANERGVAVDFAQDAPELAIEQ